MAAYGLLHRNCAADSIDGGIEGDHEAVADGLDLAAAVGSDGVAEEPEVDAAHVFCLVVAKALHQLSRADEIREENRDGSRACFGRHSTAIIAPSAPGDLLQSAPHGNRNPCRPRG